MSINDLPERLHEDFPLLCSGCKMLDQEWGCTAAEWWQCPRITDALQDPSHIDRPDVEWALEEWREEICGSTICDDCEYRRFENHPSPPETWRGSAPQVWECEVEGIDCPYIQDQLNKGGEE